MCIIYNHWLGYINYIGIGLNIVDISQSMKTIPPKKLIYFPWYQTHMFDEYIAANINHIYIFPLNPIAMLVGGHGAMVAGCPTGAHRGGRNFLRFGHEILGKIMGNIMERWLENHGKMRELLGYLIFRLTRYYIILLHENLWTSMRATDFGWMMFCWQSHGRFHQGDPNVDLRMEKWLKWCTEHVGFMTLHCKYHPM